ncbi:MAG: outer membrane lipoprotein-sorting protein [Sulfurospirillaceae bacterium]|nr:outer membrane lipoprotein-sorting protein [Sulfurospirillaceae bacterium]
MIKIKNILLFLLLSYAMLHAQSAKEIMQKVDHNMRGKSVYMELTMIVKNLGYTRTMKLQNWSEGKNKSFVKITYPPRDKGITFLSLNGQMWQYIPKIERTIKIPPSMMLQSWMGSDITNDDVVKESSLVDDYDATIQKTQADIVTIQLIPKKAAAVVWGKIILEIDTATYTMKKETFYDESDKAVRYFIYKNIKKIDGYYLPTYWKVVPLDKKNADTVLEIQNARYDQVISGEYFRQSALKRFSR